MNAWPTRVLHLGLGRFHRCHQAVYFQNLFEQTGEKWGIVSFSMRTADARNEMRHIHNRYPVVQFSKDDARLQWVEAIRASYFVKEDRAKLLEVFATPELALVTLTVTEKAYATTEIYEILYEGLRARSAVGFPLTVLSCDNLQANGARLKTGVLDFARKAGETKVTEWIEAHVAFPSSMVDRIVPSLTSERLHELQERFQTDSPEILATEVFSQWVIEDRFAGARPSLEKLGVQFVADVRPFEEMKLRLLNASHSLIAYAGLLKGFSFVHEAIRDNEIRERVSRLYAEVMPLLKAPEGFDLNAYCISLLTRFDNENLPHQLKQIAMDGSEKLKQRIIPSLLEARSQGRAHVELQGVLEAWAADCFRQTPDDPKKAKIEELKSAHLSPTDFKKALLNEIFKIS